MASPASPSSPPLLAVLTLLRITEAVLAQLLEQFLQAILQALLVLTQIAHLLLALPALIALAVALHVLTFLEGLVAQLLLFADHVGQLVERRHHVLVFAVFALRARPRRLQVFQHRLQLIEQLLGGVLVARARHLLKPVHHALEVLLAEHFGIIVERTR
jgi:hypothetical protein